jgi:hypothetical protein
LREGAKESLAGLWWGLDGFHCRAMGYEVWAMSLWVFFLNFAWGGVHPNGIATNDC